MRGRSAGDRKIRGSGIGLALVKHIAESHGGSIRVTSPITDDARGTAFVLEIPALSGTRSRTPPHEPITAG